MPFSWVKTGALDEKCSKSSIWTKNSLAGNNERHFSLGKVVFLGLSAIQVLKVTYMSYLGKVFESLRNKIQIF